MVRSRLEDEGKMVAGDVVEVGGQRLLVDESLFSK